MERLDFQLPDFTRVIWASPEARATWEPRIHAINRTWEDLERRSVLEGLRGSALMKCNPEELPFATKWAMQRGLLLLPTAQTNTPPTYAQTARKPSPGEPWAYRIIVTRPEHKEAWLENWGVSNDELTGRLLGYPDCCREFFLRTWTGEGRVDTTWAMARAADEETIVERECEPENNILWRWLGPRAVPHLPCSFSCPETREQGKRFLELAETGDQKESVGWLRELLAWPVEWSALHGIAEVKTPITKTSTRTDATAKKYAVRLRGSSYPDEGARGVRFPYQNRPRRREDQRLVQIESLHRRWKDNGFASAAAMREAHETLIRAAEGQTYKKLLDLGAGNGDLLKRLGEATGATDLTGVEVEPRRREEPAEGTTIWAADFLREPESWNDSYDLTVVMPGRLLEAEPGTRESTKALLEQRSGEFLCYAYGDWLTKYGSLEEILRMAGWGLTPAGPNARSAGAEAQRFISSRTT